MSSTFKFPIGIPRVVHAPDLSISESREGFFEWIWNRFGSEGLLGVHEGTHLCDQEWVVDSGEAPGERDWVDQQEEVTAELFFGSYAEAQSAIEVLKAIPTLAVGSIEEQKPRDWDAEWKASFLNAGDGVQVPPFWRVVPPWVGTLDSDSPGSKTTEVLLKINPGAGFGTGTHETTQLCLQALGQPGLRSGNGNGKPFLGQRALDFGSGSGILSVGLALLGADVDAIEVDPLAIDNALENSSLNHVQNKIRFYRSLDEIEEIFKYPIVVANILRPVLLDFSKNLTSRLQPGGTLVLSGLIENDVQSVLERYTSLLDGRQASILEKGEWRAIVW